MGVSSDSIFSCPVTPLFSVLCILIKILSHASVNQKRKRPKGLKFHSYWLFSSDIVAVKGLLSSGFQLGRRSKKACVSAHLSAFCDDLLG